MCLLRTVLQAWSKGEEGSKKLSGYIVQEETQEGESEEMGGGESRMFQGSVCQFEGVAQTPSRLSTPLEEKGAWDTRRDTPFWANKDNALGDTGENAQKRDTRRDKAGQAVWVRVLRCRKGKDSARYKIRLIHESGLFYACPYEMGTELFHYRPPDPSRQISPSLEPWIHDPVSVPGGSRRPARAELLFGSIDHGDSALKRSGSLSCQGGTDLGSSHKLSQALLGTQEPGTKEWAWKRV